MVLTCEFHQDLRWSCKSIAWTNGYGYNGSRNIFFGGNIKRDEKGEAILYSDGSGVETEYRTPECKCSARALILAPEDKLVAEAMKDRV